MKPEITTEQALADAWMDGYHSGFEDEGRCTHRFGRVSSLLWKISGGRLLAPWDNGKCYLYDTACPFPFYDDPSDG